jgi:hypothetical protein
MTKVVSTMIKVSLTGNENRRMRIALHGKDKGATATYVIWHTLGIKPCLMHHRQAYQVSYEEHARCERRLGKYYASGTWHGQSAASTIYVLATILERVDNDFLW